MYLAGVNLKLDKILADEYPSRYDHAQLVATHPVAITKFFDKLIQTIIDTLIVGGVLGPAISYYGTVENQGRGSLHPHVLLWLNHNMTPSQLRSRIKDENFRKNIISYLENIIKEDLSWINPAFEHLISVSSDMESTIFGSVSNCIEDKENTKHNLSDEDKGEQEYFYSGKM
ncbi:unnamed protein product [Rotaria sp. Silwood1]|nr:unnamed protein product [Rotaria sp. Silwood1]